jgi:hypothetical protein
MIDETVRPDGPQPVPPDGRWSGPAMDAGPRQAQLMFRIAASVPLAWHRAKAMVRLAQQACLPRMRPLPPASGPGWTATRASQAACPHSINPGGTPDREPQNPLRSEFHEAGRRPA